MQLDQKPAAPAAPKPTLAPAPRLSASSADLLRPRTRLAAATIALLVAALGTGVTWSTTARMVEVSSGQGRVIPTGRVRTVQNLEGGIVEALHVAEGDRVERGDLLVSIDPVQAGAAVAEGRSSERALRASATSLQAVLDGRAPEFARPEDEGHAALIERNRAEYRSTRDELASAIGTAREQARQRTLELRETRSRLASAGDALGVAVERDDMMERLAKSGATSRNEALTTRARRVELSGEVEALSLAVPRLEAAIAEAGAREAKIEARFRARLSARLNDVSAKLDGLRQSLTVDADRLRRAGLRAPVTGIVKALHANTIGQVVRPGVDVVEIVPVDEALLVRVNVDPKDIAFLHAGQAAVIRLTAYDEALYGTLKGTVTRVAADSVVDDHGNIHYPVDVRSDRPFLVSGERRLPVLPGMVARVDIVTGHKTLFDYVTKPIHRTATEAFGER